MTITDVRIRKIAAEGKMKAIVSITFDNEFVVHDIKVIEGQNGLFIAMPSRKTATGGYRDIVHPITPEGREMIEKAILGEYEKADEVTEVTIKSITYAGVRSNGVQLRFDIVFEH